MSKSQNLLPFLELGESLAKNVTTLPSPLRLDRLLTASRLFQDLSADNMPRACPFFDHFGLWNANQIRPKSIEILVDETVRNVWPSYFCFVLSCLSCDRHFFFWDTNPPKSKFWPSKLGKDLITAKICRSHWVSGAGNPSPVALRGTVSALGPNGSDFIWGDENCWPLKRISNE